MSARRRYVRYPSCFGGVDARGHVAIIRAAGAVVIQAYKMDMCCWYTVQLWGTPEQMVKIEEAWKAAKVDVPPRKPSGAWDANRKLPRAQWLDTKITAHESTTGSGS